MDKDLLDVFGRFYNAPSIQVKSKATYILKWLQRFRLGVFVPLSFCAAIFGLCFFCGFSAPGQAPSSVAKEMLQPTFPEEFHLNAQPANVWQALSEEVRITPNSRILVSEADDLVLSWVERSEHSTDASGTISHLSANDANRLQQTEIKEVGEGRVAVTTVMIIPAPKGSIIRFRRIYYGSHTQPRIANSTGAYESWMMAQISKRLGLQP